MADDLMEALTAPCGECGGDNQVAWVLYLCVHCRANRNDQELRVPLAVKDAIAATARDITEPSRMVRDMQNCGGGRGGNG